MSLLRIPGASLFKYLHLNMQLPTLQDGIAEKENNNKQQRETNE